MPTSIVGALLEWGYAERGVRTPRSSQRPHLHFEFGLVQDEVGQLLKLEDGTHCSEAAELAALRLADVRARLADLTRMEAVLSKLVGECNAHHGNVSCPLIAALHCC